MYAFFLLLFCIRCARIVWPVYGLAMVRSRSRLWSMKLFCAHSTKRCWPESTYLYQHMYAISRCVIIMIPIHFSVCRFLYTGKKKSKSGLFVLFCVLSCVVWKFNWYICMADPLQSERDSFCRVCICTVRVSHGRSQAGAFNDEMIPRCARVPTEKRIQLPKIYDTMIPFTPLE